MSEVRGIDAESLPDRHSSEWRPYTYQVLSPMNLCCDDLVTKLHTYIDIIKRNADHRMQ